MTQTKYVFLSFVDAFKHSSLDTLRGLFAPDALIRDVLGWSSTEQICPIWKDLIACITIKLRIEGNITQGSIISV
jgi:hypothetical protein